MPAQDTAESKQFCSGDLVIRSSDGVLFRPHKENLEFVSDVAFPFTSTTLHKADKAIDMQEDSKTLETLLHFAYPKLQLPDFAALSFTELIQVERAADKYQMYHGMEICQLYLARNHAFTHPYEVLELAAKRDSNVLVAAVAPFLIHLSIEEVASLGVSSRLCLKWGIYRERWLNALLEAQQYLDEHYHNHWHRLRRHMKDRLPLHAVLVLGKIQTWTNSSRGPKYL